MVLGKTLESPSDCKEIQPVHGKGDQSWMLFGRTYFEAETPVLWPPDAKHWLVWKDPDAGKDWRQEEMGMTEDEMVGWHHQVNGHEFGWIPGVSDGQGGLACCGSWGWKELDMTEWLNWTELKHQPFVWWCRVTYQFSICLNYGLLSTVILLQELQKRGIDEMLSYTFFDIYLDLIKYFVLTSFTYLSCINPFLFSKLNLGWTSFITYYITRVSLQYVLCIYIK